MWFVTCVSFVVNSVGELGSISAHESGRAKRRGLQRMRHSFSCMPIDDSVGQWPNLLYSSFSTLKNEKISALS